MIGCERFLLLTRTTDVKILVFIKWTVKFGSLDQISRKSYLTVRTTKQYLLLSGIFMRLLACHCVHRRKGQSTPVNPTSLKFDTLKSKITQVRHP